jgi:phage terminase large subunit-like protein
MTTSQTKLLKQAQAQIAEKKAITEAQRKAYMEGLPHKFGWKWYTWARAFHDSRNRLCILCAGNQVSKSSSQIRKCIEWAGNQKLWPELWPGRTPRQFWYLYPTGAVATIEFKLKWVTEFMPRNEYKNHKTYGWQEFYDKEKNIERVEFKSGITVFFKTYSQNATALQSGTVDAIFCDEELPEHLYSELNARLIHTNGYFNLVFTATLGQDMWLRALEGKGESELFPNALKQQVSMYDCQTYDDGSPGYYSLARIKEIEASCKNQDEIDRRVKGKFIVKGGRKFYAFNASKHYKKSVPKDFHTWPIWVAVDGGSGGGAHSPAISFLRVSPDYKMGVIYKAWKGDDGPKYTAGDVYNKYVELRGFEAPVVKVYDQSYKDFGTIAERQKDPFQRADKAQDRGTDVVNTLFRNDMLYLLDDPEICKLGSELTSLMVSTPKEHAKDDLADTLRYNCIGVFWDLPAIEKIDSEVDRAKAAAQKPLTAQEALAREIDERRGVMRDTEAKSDADLEHEEEIGYWNDQY